MLFERKESVVINLVYQRLTVAEPRLATDWKGETNTLEVLL